MSLRHSLSSSGKRPLSAIFIGSPSTNDSVQQSQLPSPPSTQSSNDGSLRAKSRNDLVMNHDSARPLSRISQQQQQQPRRREPTSSEEEDEHDRLHEDDQDHTARLSVQRPPSATFSRSASRAGYSRDSDASMQRSHSIAARHRQVMETLDAVTLNGRLATPPPRSAGGRSPIPRPPSRVSPGRNRPRQDTFSGSETERERGLHSPDDHSTPPTSAVHQSRFEDSYRRDEPEAPVRTFRSSINGGNVGSSTMAKRRGQSVMEVFSARDSPLFQDAFAAAVKDPPTTRTSPHKTRGGPLGDYGAQERHRRYELEDEYNRRPHSPNRSGGYRASSRDPYSGQPPSPTQDRSRPVSALNGRYMGDRGVNRLPFPSRLGESSSTVLPSPPPMMSSSSSRSVSGRFATVRERHTPSHQRWASESIQSPEDEVNLNNSRGDEPQQPRWRYQSRGGSAESALAASRLVGEGLKAAGLTRHEDEFFNEERPRVSSRAQRVDEMPAGRAVGAAMQSSSSSSAVSDITTESQERAMRNERLARLATISGNDGRQSSLNGARELRTPVHSTRGALPSRPATSMDFDSQHPLRTAPPQLRSYKSTFDRSSPLAAVLDRRSPANQPSPAQVSHHIQPSRSRLSTNNFSSSPAPDHSRLLQDAFRSFESNVRRASPNIHPTAASGCVSAAETLVEAASILNSLLRNNLDHASHEQIECEVGDGDGGPVGAELWRQVGSEFRESVKVSDEIIRTMTAFLLDVGKVMRDAASVASGRLGSPTPAGMGAGGPPSTSGSASSNHLRTMSLDEEALAARRSERDEGRSAGSGGGSSTRQRSRQSVDGASISSGGRGSIGQRSGQVGSDFGIRRGDDSRETGSLSLRRLASRRSELEYDERRPPTSMSLTRSGGDWQSDRIVDDREPDHEPSPPPALLPREEPRKRPSVLTALSVGKRIFHSRRPRTSGDIDSPQTSHSGRIDDSPSPVVRNGPSAEERRRHFPPLSIPPPLSTLPSESVLERRAMQRGAASASRGSVDVTRRKTSTGTTSLRAAGARFPSLTSPSKPTTQVTTATASTGIDPNDMPPRSATRSHPPPTQEFGARPSTASTIGSSSSRHVLASLSEQRQRTLSMISAAEDLPHVAGDEWDGQVGSVATVVDRSSAGRFNTVTSDRSSYDGGLTAREKRDRRRTAGEVFA